ncbi:Cysteine-rich RLK [Salix suchowensis]|nr:Cysteine-rich RLK [Salix suchowensis]
MNSLKFYCILLSLLNIAIIILAQEDANYLYHNCENATTSTLNSTYRVNLNLVLSSLASNATRNNINGFYNTSSGQNSDQVYGMFICRGDLSSTVCQNCVTFATKDVVQRCPIGIASIIFYDACHLRYSNRNLFSQVDQNPSFFMWNAQNTTYDPLRFNILVETSVDESATQVASARPGAKKFGVTKTYFSGFQNIYSLAQCTPILSSNDCKKCLRAAISQLPICCSNKIGGRIFSPSCYIHYEITEFYNATAVAADFTVYIYRILQRRRAEPDLFIDDTSSLTNFEEQKREDFEESSSSKLPVFDIKTITSATENFSFGNKLGQGGFGSVYKGRLPRGQEIAVKRLSKNSRQGVQEFKNEVRLISKLQHKNLVRLLGCCIYKEEKMLVYEYLPNKSLDFFIFDKTKSELLDWRQRVEIILGIARGLLYLHQDSRLKIIHRDLKAGNVLLDGAMNPKISDFGMARIFGEDQIEANTTRVVGTYGYMSPEYAMEGLYSMKSDVFSYGVLVLEVISGRKNNDYYDESASQNLIAHAWDLWNEGKALEIVDSALGETYPAPEILKFIQVGLLCVQESPEDRPKMSAIVFMLDNEAVLPFPKKPAFITRRKQNDSDSSTARGGTGSINDVTMTNMEPR